MKAGAAAVGRDDTWSTVTDTRSQEFTAEGNSTECESLSEFSPSGESEDDV